MLVTFAAVAAVTQAAVSSSAVPPRGFNSWNSFTQWISADQLLAQANLMDNSGMKALNWTYVIADGGWYYDPICGNSYMCEHIDANGRLLPDRTRYPAGWKGLCDELHAKGFKCGFHLFRGVSGKAWNVSSPIAGSKEGYTVRDAGIDPGVVPGHGAFFEINITHPSAQQYLDSMFELYCSWGIDFIKLDGIGSSGVPKTSDGSDSGGRMNPVNGGVVVSKAYRSAIEKSCSGRNVVLSLSAGGSGIPGWMNASIHDFVSDAFVAEVQDTVQMARVTPDTWDIWDDETSETACPLAPLWEEKMKRPPKGSAPRFANTTGHSGCCWGGRIAQHFVEFAHYAHIADDYGVFPDGDMLQIGRVGSYKNLQPTTLARYSSPAWSPNNCTILQLQGFDNTSTMYDTSLCPRQSYLTHEEQKTLVSLWCMARSPLIMGGDLTASPPETIALLTNRAVMEMNSHSRNASEVYRDEEHGRCAWTSTPTTSTVTNITPMESRYVGLFNLGKTAQHINVSFAALGLGGVMKCASIVDMWEGKEVAVGAGVLQGVGVGALVPRHGAVLLHLVGCS